MENTPPKKLYRSAKNEMLGGVCGGIAEYFNLDPTLIRLAFVFFCAMAGGGLIAYIIALIIVPKEPASAEPASAKAASAETAAPKTETPPPADGSTAEKTDASDESSPTML